MSQEKVNKCLCGNPSIYPLFTCDECMEKRIARFHQVEDSYAEAKIKIKMDEKDVITLKENKDGIYE